MTTNPNHGVLVESAAAKAAQISAKACDARKQLRQAETARDIARTEVERTFAAAAASHLAVLKGLAKEYRSRAYAIACREHAIPYTPNGGRQMPDAVRATPDGVELSFYWGEGRYGYFTIPWVRLLSMEAPKEDVFADEEESGEEGE
jgi:hypothetical protein